MIQSAFAVAIGAALGALLRWQAGVRLNGLVVGLPMGTLLVNLVGGYLIGVAIAVFALRPETPPAVRLLVVTGFMGGLTTFSSFSAEVVHLIQAGRLAFAMLAISLHLFGSLLMTALGIWTVSSLR